MANITHEQLIEYDGKIKEYINNLITDNNIVYDQQISDINNEIINLQDNLGASNNNSINTSMVATPMLRSASAPMLRSIQPSPIVVEEDIQEDYIIYDRIIKPVDDAEYKNIVVTTDDKSNRVFFSMYKTFDDRTLIDKHFSVIWINADGYKGETDCEDVCILEDRLYFAWNIPYEATRTAGTIKYGVRITTKDYIWNTIPADIECVQGLMDDDWENIPDAQERMKPKTELSFCQITYDANGHINSSVDMTTQQLAALNSGVNSETLVEIAELHVTDTSLQNQINEIIRAPESGGDVGAEVYDARVGVDGTDYATLKERIDTEVNDLDDKIDSTANRIETIDANDKCRFTTGKNIFNKDTALSGTHLRIDGTTEPYEGYYTSDYMPVKPAHDYWVNRAGDYTLMCWYDVNKRFVGYTMHNASTAFTAHSNAAFARLGISLIDGVQVEEGTEVTAYEPYTESLKYNHDYEKLDNKIANVAGLIVTGKNLYNVDTSQIGQHLNTDGTTNAVSGYLTSDYIEVEERTAYWLNKAGNYTLVCWYDDNKTCIGYDMHNASTAFVSEQNTKYARLGLSTSATDVQFEKGAAVTNYEPFYNTFKYEKPVVDDSVKYEDIITTGKNLYNKDKSEIGKHLNTNGATDDVSGYLTSEYIIVEPNTDYWLNKAGNYTLVCWYDEYKNCIGYAMHNASTAFTSVSSTKYARLGLTTSATDVQFEKGTAVTEFEKYYNTFIYEKPKGSDEGTVTYTLDVNGGGDFTGWVEATTAIEDIPNVTLFVKSGVYDIAAELGDTWLANYDVNVNGWGPKLGNNVHVIMEPNAILKFENTHDYSNVLTYFSPINTNYGGYTLEGGQIICKNCRYVIHEDEYSRERFGKIVIKGVYMYIDNTTDNPAAGTRCIGGGTGKCSNVTIEECVFDTPVTDRNTPLVSYHTSAAANAQSQVVIKNNYFKQHGFLRLTWYGASTLMSRFTVIGNNFGSAMPALAPEDSEHSPTNNIELLEWNNIVR